MLALSILCPFLPLAARECDQLTQREIYQSELPDSVWRLNAQTNGLLKQATAELNQRFSRSGPPLDSQLAWRLLALYIHSALARENRWFIPDEEEPVPYSIDLVYALSKSGKGPLQSWLEDPAIQGAFLQHLDEDIYLTAYPPGFNDTSSVKVAGNLVGTDKIDHFFDQGYAYWRISDYGKNDALAIAYGVDSEWGLYGVAAAGVFAYADLRANWAGYRFFKQLGSYFYYDGRGFRQIKDFNWANQVDWQWDEILNPSALTPGMLSTIHRYIEGREELYRQGQVSYSYYRTCQRLGAEERQNQENRVRTFEYLNDHVPNNLPSFADLIATLNFERLLAWTGDAGIAP